MKTLRVQLLIVLVALLGLPMTARADDISQADADLITALSAAVRAGVSEQAVLDYANAGFPTGSPAALWQGELLTSWDETIDEGYDWSYFIEGIELYYPQLASPGGASTESVRARGRGGAF